jgi:hypothetical protein
LEASGVERFESAPFTAISALLDPAGALSWADFCLGIYTKMLYLLKF